MKINQDILERIKCIDWLSKLGEPDDSGLDRPFIYVNSFEKALAYHNSNEWEDITLDKRNALTSFLRNKFSSQYSEWNKLAGEARGFLEKNVTPKLETLAVSHSLDASFIDVVKWVLIHAIMEDAYRKCHKLPVFFLDLLEIYEMGKLPCGLDEEGKNFKVF